MNLHKSSLFAAAALVVFTGSQLPAAVPQAAAVSPNLLTLASPGKNVAFQLIEPAGQPLQFTVSLNGKTVLEPSALLFIVDGDEITRGAKQVRQSTYSMETTYPWRGLHSTAHDHHNGVRIDMQSAKGLNFSLQVRAFDDGVAYRFVVPASDPGAKRTPDEHHRFNLPKGTVAWYHRETGHYEDVYSRKELSSTPAGEWAMPPVTCKLPDNAGYISITEAALVNFSGMALRTTGQGGFELVLAHAQPASHPYKLRYTTNDVERLSHPALIEGTISSPWRVILVGRDLNSLVNSDIIHNLSAPADPKLFPNGILTDWVKPGRAVWKYLDGGESTLEGTKEFCRVAGELGFEYNVAEGYWSRWSDAEVRELVSYSNERGVGLWFWRHSKELRTPQAREEFFSKLQNWGVVGAKIDFLDHEHKEVIDLYQAILADAARHKIMVNFHGANKPTGEARTWPNELTREAIKGMEASRLEDRATHDTIVPFTRYLAGAADYTVMHFGQRRGNTTWAHQIATAVIFNQPLNTLTANPATIKTNPAVNVIRSIPAVWDETRVLAPSEIGTLAVYAKRKGDDWFLACINGVEAKQLRMPLEFLPDGAFTATVVMDQEANAAALDINQATVTRLKTVEVPLYSGGGLVIRLTPVKSQAQTTTGN